QRHAPAGLPLPGGALSLAARRPLLRVLAGVLPAGALPRGAGPGVAGPLSPAEALGGAVAELSGAAGARQPGELAGRRRSEGPSASRLRGLWAPAGASGSDGAPQLPA